MILVVENSFLKNAKGRSHKRKISTYLTTSKSKSSDKVSLKSIFLKQIHRENNCYTYNNPTIEFQLKRNNPIRQGA